MKRQISEDYTLVDPNDSEKTWSNTSRWTEHQLCTLRIAFSDSPIQSIVEQDVRYAILSEDTSRLLLPGIHISSGHNEIENLTVPQKKFYNNLSQLQIFADEPPVDLVATDLLNYTDFNNSQLRFRPRPKVKMEWKGKKISSESDFAVYSYSSRNRNPPEYLLIVEDKRPGSGNPFQPERQLAGEMLAAAYQRASFRLNDKEIFGMIFRGGFIRFYKCLFPESYLRNLANDQFPDEQVVVHRYPSEKDPPLSMFHPEQRERIVRILCVIREHLLSVLES